MTDTSTPLAFLPPLTGLYFHVFGDGRVVQYQGRIRAMVGERHVLVQYFEWKLGEPNTLEIIPLERMTHGATWNKREAGTWQFYETADQMNQWYADHPTAHPSHAKTNG